MTIDAKFEDEKVQYNICRAAGKTSALSLGKIDKCEYVKGEEMLSPQQHIIT